MRGMVRKALLIGTILGVAFAATHASAQRVKDLTQIQGMRNNHQAGKDVTVRDDQQRPLTQD